MDLPEIKFSESCKTIACKQQNIFISAFPGKIVFGDVCSTGYKQSRYFKFEFYQMCELYISLINIINFLVSSEKTSERHLIIKINETTNYFWLGNTVLVDKKESKVVQFGIESQSDVKFKIDFNGEQLNNLIKYISEMILPCLCLQSNQRQIFQSVIKQSISVIVSLNNYQTCQKYLQNEQQKSNLKIDDITLPNLIDELIYYNELLLIIYKIKSLHNSEITVAGSIRIQAILDA